MQRRTFLILCVITLLAGGGFWLWHSGGSFAAVLSGSTSSTTSTTPYILPTLTQDYKNDTYNFSLKLPADFTVATLPSEDSSVGDTIVFQNTTGDGIQVVVSPWDEPASNLTEDRIKQDVSDMAINNVQTLQVGENSSGLAFKSNNESFSGASREVWFVFNGNLYQISTYDRLDPLLKAIFATWQFF